MSAPAAEPAAPAGRGRLWQGLLGVAVSVGFLVWALWGVDLADVGRQMLNAHPGWFLASVLAVTATFPLRAIRWQILLHSSVGATRFKPVWDATAIGFMANNVLPARAGEVVRSYAADQLVGVPFSTALASVAVERVFDGILIVLLLAAGVAAPGFPAAASGRLAGLAATMTGIFVGALIVLIVMVRNRDRAMPVAERLVHRVAPARLADRAIRIVHNLVAGLGVLKSTRDVVRVLVWSLVIWAVNGMAFGFAFYAFDLDVPLSAAFVLQGVVAFGVAIPAAPGFFGVFEGLSKAVLLPYGVAEGAAVSFALGTHMGWFVPITVIGLVILARTGLTLKGLSSGSAPAAPTAG